MTAPTPSPVPGEPRWECVVPMSVRFRTCTEAKSHASCRTYNENQRASVPPAPSAPGEGRPGGWVEGIGWVCLRRDLTETVEGHEAAVAVVTRWADGTTPTPPAPLTPTPQPEIVRYLSDRLRLHAESTDANVPWNDGYTTALGNLIADLTGAYAHLAAHPSTPADPRPTDPTGSEA